MSYNALSGSLIVRHPGNFQANYLSGNLSNSDGSDVINVPRISNATNDSVITNVSGDANNLTCESNLKFDGDTLSITGELTASTGVSASYFMGDGSRLSGISATGGGGIFTEANSSKAYTTSSINVGSSATPSHTLNVVGTMSGSGTFQAVGAAYLGGTLGVTGALTAKSTVSGGASTFTTLAGTSLALQNGGITAAGAIAGATNYSGSGTLQTVGATTLGSTLNVSGAATLAGTTSAQALTATTISGSGTLQAVGATYLGATLGVTGALTAKSTVSGAASTFTTLAGTSLALQNGGITATGPIAGATTYSGSSTLHTVGAATFGNTLNVTGAVSGAAAFTGATWTSDGAISGSSTLEVVGATTFGSTVGVTGSMTAASASFTTVHTTGDSQFDGGVILGNADTDVTRVQCRLTASEGAYFGNRVGIGTTTPDELLHVRGTSPKLLLRSDASQKAQIRFDQTGGTAGDEVQLELTTGGHFHIVNKIDDKDIFFTINPDGVYDDIEMLRLDATTKMFHVNPDDSSRMDFKMGSSGNSNALFVGGGDECKVGISTGTPSHKLTVNGSISGSGNFLMGKTIIFTGPLNVSGAATFASTTSGSGQVTYGNNVLISGDTYIGGGLNVSGAVAHAGATTFTTISASSTLEVVGATILGSTLNVSGAITAASTVSGTAATFTTIGGTSLALQSGGITAAGAIAGATTVSGTAVTFTTLAGTSLALQNGGITAAGAIAATTYSGSSTLHTVGAATFGSTLAVTGASTFNGAVALGDATGDLIGFTGSVGSDIIPDVDNEWDLGSSSKKFNTLYVNNISSPIDIIWDVEAVGNGDTIASGTDFALVTAGNRSNVTLPAASAGKHVRIKLSSSIGDVFVNAGSGDLIEGEPFILMESTGSAIICAAYDAQSWFIV